LREEAAENERSSGCGGALAVAFPEPKDPVLRCVLTAYDKDLETLCDRSCLLARVGLCAEKDKHARRAASNRQRKQGGG
jgi:hypothetical protein